MNPTSADSGRGSGQEPPIRWLELQGAFNVRDIGGQPARRTATALNVLYRGDNLDRVTASDVSLLVGEHRLRAVIDLRRAVECNAPPQWLSGTGVEYRQIPLFDLSGETLADIGAALRTDVRAAYRAMLEQAGPAIAQVVAVLINPGPQDGPVIVHCAAGKDRTGIVVAVLLAAVGVPDEFVAADYMASGQRIGAVREALRRRSPDLDTPYPGSAPMTPVAIEAVLDTLRSEPGGAQGYLARWGIRPAEAARLTALMLAPATP